MKKVSTILFLFISANLFAQNKHNELYNQIETICTIISKYQIDTLHKPLLILDGITYNDYAILDSYDRTKIISFEVIKSSLRQSNYIIAITSNNKLNLKKKKRKSKNN
jgi:hypothetical protein